MAVASPHASGAEAGDRPVRRSSRSPAALLVALVACLLYAAFADGATQLPQDSRLQLALGLVATGACGVWLYGGGLRVRAAWLGWIGLALLALLAAWSAVSIAWSVAPDRSWEEVNRALSYALVAWMGLMLGSSLERAPERLALALALVSVPVCLYALGGKTLPGVHVAGLFDLNHASGFNRLRAPLGYWNALALVCVIGALPMLRLAADPSRRPRWRIAALLALFALVVVVGMTYSRGGVLALLAGVFVLVALTTERVRTLAAFGSALVASTLPLGVALTRPDLIADTVPLARREDDALVVLVTVLVVGVLLALWGRVLIGLERRPELSPARARALGRPAVAIAGGIVVLGLLNAVATGRAASALDTFRDTSKAARLTDPNRLLSSNSGNRWTWWKEAAGAWSDKPVGGWGAGSFPVTHKLYRRDVLSVQQPHSVPLQWLAETGIVGLALAAGGLLALLAAALARVRSETWAISGAAPARGAAAALLAVAVAWMVHSLYDWDWDIPAVTLPMLLCLGVLAARPRPEAGGPVAARGPALAAAVTALVLVALSVGLPALADSRTDSALAAVGDENVSEARLTDAAADAELAARLNPLAVTPLIAGATIAERRGRSAQAREYLLRALRRQPSSVDAWVRLVRLEFQRLDRAALRRAAMRALALDPMNPGTIGLARRAQQNSALPFESSTATGSPLPTQVPITEMTP